MTVSGNLTAKQPSERGSSVMEHSEINKVSLTRDKHLVSLSHTLHGRKRTIASTFDASMRYCAMLVYCKRSVIPTTATDHLDPYSDLLCVGLVLKLRLQPLCSGTQQRQSRGSATMATRGPT